MKAILKVSDLRKIAKATGLNLNELKDGAYWLNRGNSARTCFTRSEINAVVVYLITREVNASELGGECSGARAICCYIDSLLSLPFGFALGLMKVESARSGRWLIAELNMGLDHITLTHGNPYASQTLSVAI